MTRARSRLCSNGSGGPSPTATARPRKSSLPGWSKRTRSRSSWILPEGELTRLFDILGDESLADLLSLLDERDAADILEHMSAAQAADILEEIDPDDATDIIAEVEPEFHETILVAMEPEEAAELRELMAYPPESAGGIMTPAFVAISPFMRADQAVAALRKVAEEAETVNYVYVLDDQERLLGVLSLHRLVLTRPDTPVSDLMFHDPVTVAVDADQEFAARLLTDRDLLALPVVDADGRLVGIITADDVHDVLEQEATEDIERLGGSAPLSEPYLRASPFLLFRKRIVWLLALFLAQFVTLAIYDHYEGLAAEEALLSLFVPILIGTGGNVGSQTVTTVIRAMAVGEAGPRHFFRIVGKGSDHGARAGRRDGRPHVRARFLQGRKRFRLDRRADRAGVGDLGGSRRGGIADRAQQIADRSGRRLGAVDHQSRRRHGAHHLLHARRRNPSPERQLTSRPSAVFLVQPRCARSAGVSLAARAANQLAHISPSGYHRNVTSSRNSVGLNGHGG